MLEKLKQNRGKIVIGILLLFITILGILYFERYFYILKDPKKIKTMIMSYGDYSIVAFLILQIIQVIVFFIPGEIVQISGGYIYGAFYGGLLSLIGISLGTSIVFGISHVFGKPFIKKIISQKDFKLFDKLLNLGRINYVVFLLYLIPGIPKDALAYICGVSSISFRDFIIYSTIARIPCMFVSAYFGANLDFKHKGLLIFIAFSMTILFLLGVYKGDFIVKKLAGNRKEDKE